MNVEFAFIRNAQFYGVICQIRLITPSWNLKVFVRKNEITRYGRLKSETLKEILERISGIEYFHNKYKLVKADTTLRR